ncbi:TonB-dependent receptor plug domain-containing protein [Treponema bryantii]|uniref:TonB-dependent receptor plug domain-containing protein n=1 Tax=Treponema bryantii TaxID=163 RepID=UPI0003B42F25|nr:TonB-dependent receptor [Treponema bryantii]
MKKFLLILSIVSFRFFSFAQEAEITLPQVTTYIPAAVEQKLVITAEEIAAAHYEDLSDLVERAGLQVLSYGPYGLESKPSIRGFTDETVRVVIDGICVNNAQYGTFDFSSINLNAVERIEIVRGGFTEGVEDEGAVGGVVYITMKKNEMSSSLNAEVAAKTFFNTESFLDSAFQKLSYGGRLGENTFLNADGTLNYAGNHYLYKVDGNLSLCDGPFGAGEGYFLGAKNAQVTDGHGNASLTHYFGDGNYFSFGEIFYGGHKNTPGPVNSKNPGLQRDYNNNFSFSVWNPALADGLFNLKNNLVWLCNNRFYKDESGSEDSQHFINTIKYTGSADFTSLAGGRIRQMIGISSDITNLDSTNDGQHIQFSGVIKETTKVAAAGGWSFSLPLAIKFCANDDNINFAFVPKIGTAWEAGKIKLFADLYRMVQFPNMDDLFWDGAGYHGNPELKPESGWGADLGFTLRGEKLNGGLTLFSNYYKDKIQWGSGTTQNLSSAFYLGIDFNFKADLFAGFWTLDFNGEYLYNRLLDKSNKYTYGKRIMWTPDLTCTLISAWNFELVRISLSAAYTGRRYTSNLNVYYLKPYLLLGLAAEAVPVRGKFTPYLKADNLLNWQYQSVDGYSMPGISLTLGAKYKFF